MNSKFQQNMWFVIFMLCLLASIYVYLIQQTANTLAPSILLVIVAIFASMALLERKSHHLINAKA